MFIINNTSTFNSDSVQLLGLFVCLLVTVVLWIYFRVRIQREFLATISSKSSTKLQHAQHQIFSVQIFSDMSSKIMLTSEENSDTLFSNCVTLIWSSMRGVENALLSLLFFFLEMFVQVMNATHQFVTLNYRSQNPHCIVGRNEILTSNGNKFLSIIAGICHE